jgi:hypothetical protein
MTPPHELTVSDRPPWDWRAADVAAGADWCVPLDAADREEIAAAARAAVAAGETPQSLRRESFPLPTLSAKVAVWSAMVHEGRGFVLLRGFPVDLLAPDEVEVGFVGLGLHLGRPVGQNAAGDLLTHIRDERLPDDDRPVRLYRTRARQDFHTDGADVVGLLCLHRARSGGESRVVSSRAVIEEIRRRRPQLLDVLAQPMCWDRQGEQGQGERPWFSLAPLVELASGPRLFYIGWYIRDAQRHSDVPRLTPEQLEAMALIESIANDPAFHVEMEFEPGDVQLIDNGRILHAREAYEDDEDPAKRRHLLRLWLAAHSFTSVEPGLRQGINTPPTS